MRIDVVGMPASGKSTFAEAVAKKLSIPHIHLDRFWFESGGRQGRYKTSDVETIRARVREKVIEATKADKWVSDGIFLHVQDVIVERADTIIFLNIPLYRRLWNHAKRIFFEPKRHNEVTMRDDIAFFLEIIKRDFTSKPKLLKFISAHQEKVVVLSSKKDIDHYLLKV